MASVENAEVEAEPQEADPERIGTMSNVFKQPDVVVGEPEEVVSRASQKGRAMIEVRVNSDIEDMSYVSKGRREQYKFEAGKVYRVPVEIAAELERIGKVWH